MKNLYKKICVVVLSSVILSGGVLASNSPVSHANSLSVKLLVNGIVGEYNYYCKYIGKYYNGNDAFNLNDPFDLYDLIDSFALRSGVYNIKGEFFFIGS